MSSEWSVFNSSSDDNDWRFGQDKESLKHHSRAFPITNNTMGKSAANPTIRVLLLGAPGVGKNCLESRFTTRIYPPPYDPALTLNSRRFYTLSPRPRRAELSSSLPLNTPHGLAGSESPPSDHGAPRPNSASSAFSHAGSASHGDASQGEALGTRGAGDGWSIDSTIVSSETCTECVRESQINSTYLVEVINYPALQAARERAHVHSRAEYDAVLLVYDVASRRSLEAVKALHAEIPICTRKNHHHHRRAAGHANTARNRTSAWFGGGANDTGSTGSGEIVVAVVGNKSDFDAEYASVELGLDGPLLEKEAERQGVDVEQRSLVHPLYRESRFYRELDLQDGLPPATEPTAAPTQADEEARAPPEEGGHGRPRSLPYGKGGYLPVLAPPNDKTDDIEKWLQTGRPSGTSAVDEAADGLGRVGTHETDTTTAPARQVSRLDGEALVRSLGLRVPFYETSAKTGENVEAAFDATVREVLREMGRDADGPRRKSCRHRAPRTGKAAKAERTPEVGPVAQGQDRVPGAATVAGGGAGPRAVLDDMPPPKRLKRRQSMIDRFRNVFTKKPPPAMASITA